MNVADVEVELNIVVVCGVPVLKAKTEMCVCI